MRYCLGFLVVLLLLASAFDPINGLFYRPVSWPEPRYNFNNNPQTKEGFELGRALFYDPILSKDSTISCASCHFQYTAFAHVDHPTSHGVDSRVGKRNAPGLMNMAWAPYFHWDGGVLGLNGQAINPMIHPDEMGSNLTDILLKLNRNQGYKNRFNQVFGSNEINTHHLLKALAQFTVSLVSANSKYDQWKQGNAEFTAQEERGYKLFKAHCNQCHTEPLFTSYGFKANGIGPNPQILDSGRALITGKTKDVYLFKVPSLRNVEHSFPYMHDGRMAKLKEVIHHYATSSTWKMPISKELKKNIALNSDQEKDLLSFLKTLTDQEFLLNRNYGFPK